MHVTGSKGPARGGKGCTKKTGVTPLVGLMDPYSREECGFFKMLPGSKDPRVAYKGVKKRLSFPAHYVHKIVRPLNALCAMDGYTGKKQILLLND